MASPTGWTSFSTLQEMQDGKPGCFSPWGRQEPNTSEVLNNNCSSPHPSHIIISGLSLALAINLNAQHVKLSLKCLHILQSLRIFPHYYTALSTILVSNPKFSPIPTGFHWTGKHPTKPHFFNSKKIFYTSIKKGLTELYFLSFLTTLTVAYLYLVTTSHLYNKCNTNKQ